MRIKIKVVAILEAHYGIIGLAELAGTLDNGPENRPDIGRRGGDHLEDVAASSLISQRLREVTGLRLRLVEQADIAERDHRLIGESLQQGDLLVAERLHVGAAQHNRTDAFVFAQQRYAQYCANIGPAREFPGVRELFAFRSEKITDMNRPAIDDGTPGCPVTVDRLPLPNDRNRSVLCLENEFVAFLQHHQGIDGLAEIAGAFDDGLENRPDFGRRGSDYAEDVAAPGLIGQRLGEIACLGLNLLE